jgi:hypothetical protein
MSPSGPAGRTFDILLQCMSLLLAHRVNWRSAAVCLKLGADRTRLTNGENETWNEPL